MIDEPLSILRGTFEELQKAGCIQCEFEKQREMFHALMEATRCDPCTAECPARRIGGKCEAYKKFHTRGRRRELQKEQVKERAQPVAVRPKCPKCGRKIRGKNHNRHCEGGKGG